MVYLHILFTEHTTIAMLENLTERYVIIKIVNILLYTSDSMGMGMDGEGQASSYQQRG